LSSKGRTVGAMTLQGRRVSAYGPKEQSVLERPADQIAPRGGECQALPGATGQHRREGRNRWGGAHNHLYPGHRPGVREVPSPWWRTGHQAIEEMLT